MKGRFFVDIMDGDQIIDQRVGENIILDDGIRYLISGDSNGLFFNPNLLIGSSDYPTAPDQSGNLAPLWIAPAQITTSEVDSGDPYVFFSIGARFNEDDGIGQWSEISYQGWNRSLLTSPSSMANGLKTYALTSFNANGESFLSPARTVTVNSPPLIGPVLVVSGNASMPNKTELLEPTPASDTISINSYTLSWAKDVTGFLIWAAAIVPNGNDGARDITIYVTTDGKYHLNFGGSTAYDIPIQSGDSILTMDAGPSSLISSGAIAVTAPENWRLKFNFKLSTYPQLIGGSWFLPGDVSPHTEAEVFGMSSFVTCDTASFNSVYQAYYKISSLRLGVLTPFHQVALPVGYGYNPANDPHTTLYAFDFIGAPSIQTDPTIYPIDRAYHTPFSNFWGSASAGEANFTGEVITAPGHWQITLFEGLNLPQYNDLSQVIVYGGGTNGGVYIEWAQQTEIGPGGRAAGYNLYRKKLDGTWGLLLSSPAIWNPATGILSGNTHFWDRDEVPPGAAPVESFLSPLAPDDSSVIVNPLYGMLPKPIFKTDLMKGQINTQIFFYDFSTNNPTSVDIAPSVSTIAAGTSVALTAIALNDYGVAVTGQTFIWSAPIGGTISPSGASANFSANLVGTYQAAVRTSDLTNSAQVNIIPAAMASISLGDSIAGGGSAADVQATWDSGRTTLTVTLPRSPDAGSPAAPLHDAGPPANMSFTMTADIMSQANLRVPISGMDAFGNPSSTFARNWSLDGVSQRALLLSGAYSPTVNDVTGTVFLLQGDGLLTIKAPGSATIEVREVLSGNIPSSVVKTFTVVFAWR